MHRFVFLLTGVAGTASAHEGHGIVGVHLHASDVFGFVVLAVAVVGAVWWRGRR